MSAAVYYYSVVRLFLPIGSDLTRESERKTAQHDSGGSHDAMQSRDARRPRGEGTPEPRGKGQSAGGTSDQVT